MANASAKRQAILNHNHLRILHNISYLIYAATFGKFYVAGERYVLQFFFCVPGIIAEILLDRWCKPTYGPNKTLISPGLDISQPGLIDYTKDVMFLNWFILLLSVGFGPKVWFLVLLVPLFVTYKGLQLLKMGKELMSGSTYDQLRTSPPPQAAGAQSKGRATRRA